MTLSGKTHVHTKAHDAHTNTPSVTPKTGCKDYQEMLIKVTSELTGNPVNVRTR